MIGQRVREMRMEKRLSLSELAKRTKITKSYLSNIERNICTNPTIDVIQKLASGFKVHPSALLNWKEDKKASQSTNGSLECIKSKMNFMDDEQLRELKDYADVIQWKREKIPLNDLIKFI
ncbi:transcriptional regulator [Priestia megaterium]|uniref:helix-turn-helix domain-containing protein n=1 Tax=Priestia megaterium TaxID=1404 RepID=UPI000BFD99A2|nr:helix-turn-helix transcriptional regulator [Priestia megaterium]PGK22486.1 transcriptional regulator [Priestia megaterium]